MLNQIDFSIANFGLACGVLSGLSLLYYYVKFALHEWRIRKIGGVRAPRLAYTPIGGTIPSPMPQTHTYDRREVWKQEITGPATISTWWVKD